MNIYEYQTYEISNLAEANSISEKFKNKKINLLHKYEAIIWQGPQYIQITNEKLKKKKVNYIVELRDNLGLIISLINLKIKNMAITQKIKNKTLMKIMSIAKNKKVKILFIEKFNIEEKIH
tara:strand:- start:20 stop:382 length:363 start_codon:yes stop_codon:yes gene_type:complete